MARVEAALAVDIRQGATTGRGGAGRPLRKLVLRLIVPFTHHERNVDRELRDAIRGLRDELD